jgi:beta-glucosidase
VSAYQVEGAVDADGRGESIWDRFSATPGKVVNGDSGAVACDSYHRYREDVRLVTELGLNAFVTLYHWDLPQALEERGGWPARETAEAFAEYVDVVSERLDDRVHNWITQCEPWVISWLGYGLGEHAPGRRSEADALAAAHHVLLGHGLAADVLRSRSADAKVGITIDLVAFHPLTDSPDDLAAVTRSEGFRNRWILDPVLRGAYPEDMLEVYAPILPPIEDGDLETIATPLDFLGINYYTRTVVRADAGGGPSVTVDDDGAERTAMGWEVYPEGLYELLARLRDEYELPPLYVTENGAAYADRRDNGSVHDPKRISYVERHLAAIERAIEDGIPVRGYFLWSLLDNFEWAFGYSRRFGIVYVDYETLERVPKASFHWYRDFIAASRAART